MKKLLTVGVGTVFLTEESLRKLITDFKIPVEMVSGLLESARTTRTEFLQNFSKEIVSRLSDKVDPRKIIDDFLLENEVELNIKIKFKPKDPT
jgi:hypothetical protein